MRRLLLFRVVLWMAAALALPATSVAATNSPEQIVTGNANASWFSGSLIQQYGQNCSTAILGDAYSEVMTNGYSEYGGTNGVVKVGDKFWASIVIGIPGFPCGSGSAGIQTDLFLPAGVQPDTTRGIRCFGIPSAGGNWQELTGGPWQYSPSISGQYCNNSVGPSTLSGGGYQVGFRVLASGQLFQLFVPVQATQQLSGGAGQVFDWLVSSTAAYANPALTRSSAFVFPASVSGSGPQVFFSRQPAAQPYWTNGVDNAHANRVETWASVYTAGLAGNLSYVITRTDTNQQVWSSAAAGASWNGSVGAGETVVQVNPAGEAKGPNGGYSPVYFDPPGTPGNPAGEWGVPMKITWTFTPSGSSTGFSQTATFTTLSGPDTDNDGVPDSTDKCPSKAGSGADGCTPLGTSADGDLDGVLGAADLCPTVAAPGTANGCPPAAPQVPTSTLSVAAKAPFARTKLVGKSGVQVSAKCTAGATATFTLTASKPTAKVLKLKTKPLPVLATAKGPCGTTGAATLLKITDAKLKKRVKAAKGKLTATLTLTVSSAGGSATPITIPVRLK